MIRSHRASSTTLCGGVVLFWHVGGTWLAGFESGKYGAGSKGVTGIFCRNQQWDVAAKTLTIVRLVKSRVPKRRKVAMPQACVQVTPEIDYWVYSGIVTISIAITVAIPRARHWSRPFTAQVADTRPVDRIRPSTLFYMSQHLVSTRQQSQALA